MIETLFFELILVAIGTRICLSHTPSADEWGELYAMAKKQSLVGICFAGVQRLGANADDGFSAIGMPEMLYLTWMGMAAKIQQRNEVVNKQCVELQKMLLKEGFHTSILKGQGVGMLYGENLSMLRQSGDIDLWIQGGMQKAYDYCKDKFGTFDYDYINAHAPFYSDTEVELHWRVHSLPNPFANRRLQRWFEEHEDELHTESAELKGAGSIVVPSKEFNAFFILLHCYHHMFESGLGLRQLMDYYFVLCTAYENTSTNSAQAHNENIVELYEQFGMMRFAKGVMWIMQHVFGLDDKCLLCEPDEKEGKFLLNEIMLCGNFGHHDERKHKIKNKMVAPFATRIQHNWHLVTHYPSEFFWSPVCLVWHYVWKRNWKKNNR